MTWQWRTKWRWLLDVNCPYCGANRGHPCTARYGYVTDPHIGRTDRAHRWRRVQATPQFD